MATLTAQPIRVLIVDDEPKVALTVAANLGWLGAGIVVDTAHSFADAFSRVQRNQYALLIVDYDIPGLSGLDLARAEGRIWTKVGRQKLGQWRQALSPEQQEFTFRYVHKAPCQKAQLILYRSNKQGTLRIHSVEVTPVHKAPAER